MFRYPLSIIMLTSLSVMADLASDIETLTGGRTKIIWARGIGNNNDADLTTVNYKLMGYDTYEGHERVLVPGPISCANPWITPDGQRIVFTSCPDTQIYLADWTGQNLRRLLKGYGLCLWSDPVTNRQWIYYSDYPYGTVIYRCEIDSLSHRELVWNKTQVSIRFRVSADGTHGGGEFPWPTAGEVTLPNNSFLQYGSGCNSQIAPDNSYRFFVLEGGHKNLLVCDSGKTNCREISVSSILASGNTIWAPRWSNAPELITCKVDQNQNIYMGKFNDSFTAVQQWLRITSNADTFDNYAYVWVGLPAQMRFSPDSLFFGLDSNRQGIVSQTVQVSNIHNTLPRLSASTTASWLTLQVSGQNNAQCISNTVSPAALESGIYSTSVTVTGAGIPSEQYNVKLRIDGKCRPSSMMITPGNPVLPCSSSVQFTAKVYDQFLDALNDKATWRIDSGGSISDNGLFRSNGSTGHFTVSACDSGNLALCATTSMTVYKDMIVTSPANGLLFHTGETMHVQWKGKTPNMQGAVVSLSLDNGRSWEQVGDRSIGINDADWGDFAWIIADSITTDKGKQACISNQCKIRVADYNRGANSDYFSDGVFTIQHGSMSHNPVIEQAREMKIRVQKKSILMKASLPILSVDVYDIRGTCVARFLPPLNRASNEVCLQLNSGFFLVKAKTQARMFTFKSVVP